MQKVLEQNTVPPGGWRYLQAETRTLIEAPDYHELFRRVRDHRAANNIPLDQFWADKVEHQLCETLPPGLCKEQGNSAEVRNIIGRVTWDQVYNGTHTFVNWAFRKFGTVDQNLANARGAVCASCYYNVGVSGTCASCGHLQNLASAFTKGRVTSADSYLKACAVCQCSLRVKVWTPIESIAAGTPETSLPRYPDFCWIRKEMAEYRKQKQEVLCETQT
jgi:hypothetical protein